MIKMDQYELIRTAHFVYKKGIREIAKEYGHSRKTVRKALRGEIPGYCRKKETQNPVMDSFKETVESWILADKEVPRKQRHTAHRVYTRLVKELDFKGSESTIRRFVRNRKASLGLIHHEAMVPLEAGIDSGAEVDWGDAYVEIEGVRTKVKLFCMRSRFSGDIFVQAYAAERQEMFFDGHIRAFDYFSGVFRELTYDNLTTAVQKVLKGRQRKEQAQFINFRSYYSFQAKFCAPAKGNEKGGVEGMVGYVRRNFLVPLPQVNNLEELNSQFIEQCLEHRQRIKNKGGERIADLQERQQSILTANQKRPFENVRLLEGKVNKYQTVQVDRNMYSVPQAYVSCKLDIHLGCRKIGFFFGKKQVAEHYRNLGRNQWQLNPFHYLTTLMQKTRAFDEALPLKAWRKCWPTYYETFLDSLRRLQGERGGTQAFIEVLRLHEIYPDEVVEEAVRVCAEKNVYCSGAVKQTIFRRTEIKINHPQPIGKRQLPEILFKGPNVANFNRILDLGSAK